MKMQDNILKWQIIRLQLLLLIISLMIFLQQNLKSKYNYILKSKSELAYILNMI